MLPWGQGWAFLPWNKPKACWRAKMPTPARRAAYCWVRKTSAECRATKYWRYFSIAKELSLSKYTSFPWFYWIRDFVTLQNTVFLIAKSGKEINFLSPCYARRKRKKLGTQKQLQEGKRCCKVTNPLLSKLIQQRMKQRFLAPWAPGCPKNKKLLFCHKNHYGHGLVVCV